MYHNFCIYSSVDGNLGLFHVLAIVDSVAMNIRVHMSLRIIVFLRVLLGHMVVLVLVFVSFFNESPHCSS